MSLSDPDTTLYKVVINEEERMRYGLPIGRTQLAGRTSARQGSKPTV